MRGKALAGIAATLLSAAVVVPMDSMAEASSRLSCGTVTAQDNADAAYLRPRLTERMGGKIDGYNIACARRVLESVRARGFPQRVGEITMSTIIVETDMQNLSDGHSTSAGLFQQLDFWGSYADRTNPAKATSMFLDEMVRIFPNGTWQNHDRWYVAAEVQRPLESLRYRYDVEMPDGIKIAARLWSDPLPVDRAGVAVGSRRVGGLDVFARASDGSFRYKNWNGEDWSGWTGLGGGFTSDPAVHVSGDRIDVFGTSSNGHLWWKTWTPATDWSGWKDMGATFKWTPAVTSRGGSTLDLFVVHASGEVMHRYFNGTSWNMWRGLKATATSAPAADALGNERINIAVRHTNGSLLTRMWTRSSGWHRWIDRKMSITGTPSISHRTTNLVDIFTRDPADKSVRHSVSTNGGSTFSGPVDLGGTLVSAPSSVSMWDKRIDVFAVGTNGNLYQRVWSASNPPDGWYPWTNITTIP